MNRRLPLAALFVLILVPLGLPPSVGAGGEIYRWVDADGVMHFSNQPPPAGVRVLDRVAETPHDPVADRERREAEREALREFERRELEDRKARAEERERQARRRLEEAERRLEEARRLEEQARRPAEDCDREWFLRYGTCEGFVYAVPGRRVIIHGRTPRPDECRDWYRENNSIYCRDPRKPPPELPEKPPRKSPTDDTRKPPPKAPRATRPPAAEDPAAPRR